MSKDLPNHSTIHIDIPVEADNDEVDWFLDEVATAVYDIPVKGEWDPFISWHRYACEDSDHCYGAGSNEEARIHDEALQEAIEEVRKTARAHVEGKRGHMTWAEVVVMLNGLKLNRNPEQADEQPSDH